MTHRSIGGVIGGQNIVCTAASISVAEAARLMKANRVGSLMVVEGERLIGIFTERDALFRVLAEGRDAEQTLLQEVMTANPQTIDADRPVSHALHMMYEGGFRHVPVVANGRPVGMISARDALAPEVQAFEAEQVQREHIGEMLG
jgi:CBS domain-containing protein